MHTKLFYQKHVHKCIMSVRYLKDLHSFYHLTIKCLGRGTNIQLFHACLVNSQNYATRCRGQLKAEGRGQLCIELSKVPRGIVLTILPNKHKITVDFTQRG